MLFSSELAKKDINQRKIEIAVSALKREHFKIFFHSLIVSCTDQWILAVFPHH